MHAYLTLPPWFGLVLTAVVCGGAFWKGGAEEKGAAGALLFCWVATLVLRDPRWGGTQWGGFAVDVGFLAILGAISLRSVRFWPLFATAFQLLAVLTHAARVIDPQLQPWAYATAGVIWTQLVLWSLGVGVWNAWRAARQPAMSAAPEAAGATRR